MKNEKYDIRNGFIQWKVMAAELEDLYKVREKHLSGKLMDDGLLLFYQLLFAVNDSQLPHDISNLEQLSVKPINIDERIRFIQCRKGSFHSFKQLGELFKELEKQYAKKASLGKI